MCGVNGVFAYKGGRIDRDELLRTRDYMAARGPDGAGEWLAHDRCAGFAHRRLAIIDLSPAGAQPMVSGDGRLVVVFNGEIYNHVSLRTALEARGHVFRSHSDTEVLLSLYAEKGEAMVHDLRGMFAFAIWDTERRSLFIARDPYGIKPLYYCDDGKTFRFASQVKALLAGGAVSRSVEPAGKVGFYLWGSVPEPFTMYDGVRALPAGCMLRVDGAGAGEARRFHSIAKVYCDAEARAQAAQTSTLEHARCVRERLLDSVRHHLVADVPVGAFLSAGIDSSALVGLMRAAGQQDIQTVTLAFDEFRGQREDEAPLAAEVARLFGTRHTTRLVGEAEFEADLPRILDAMDQPSIDGINTWFVSKSARELGLKVAMSGLGGDELFGGYPSFRDVPRWVGLFKAAAAVPTLGRAARRLLSLVVDIVGYNPKAAGLPELGGTYAGAYFLRRGLFMPWELASLLDPELVRTGLERLSPLLQVEAALEPCPQSAFARVGALEAQFYLRNQLLRDTDWASMAHSVEVRVPLVDATLLSAVTPHTLASGSDPKKLVLAASPDITLPSSITRRRKTGFMTPLESWARKLAPIRKQSAGLLAAPGCPWIRRWTHFIATA